MAEPIILIKADDPERRPQLYACPKCGHCVSPRIFACADEHAHQTARDMAANCSNCRTHNTCSECGAECSKPWTACEACRRAKAIAKATLITLGDDEPCYGLDSGEFFPSVADARDADEEYVFPCTLRTYELAEHRIEEEILDDHHEDADVSELVGYDELIAAIRKFNEAQTGGSYDEDRTRIARVAKATGGA